MVIIMIFGADYYPEHWNRERWETDAMLMREANLNVVRLAEFAWSRLEPNDGCFDFTWLDDAIAIFAKYGIQVVLGTPTAAAPKWLMDKTDAYYTDINGRKKNFGTRRHYCPNDEEYHYYSKRIAHEMAKHYAHNNNILAWQIDNEFGNRCYCDNCVVSFQQWLKDKYGTIDSLNKHWGNVFWSHEYQDFNQVVIPRYGDSYNPAFILDYNRFYSDSIVKYQKMQINEIRRFSDKPITHNFMGHYGEINYFDLGRDIDFVSWDCYPCDMWNSHHYLDVSMAHDLMRGVKNQNFWVMEQQSGANGWHYFSKTPEPGQIRLWTYQSIAHGADAIVYFRWRACLFGIEQYWYGILDHDGVPRRRYAEIKQIGEELKKYGDLLEGAKNLNEVLMVKSYDNLWSHGVQKHSIQFDYTSYMMDWYIAFSRNNIGLDVSSENVDFSKYKVVCLPTFNLVNKTFADKCKQYVENGGTILLTFRSGTKNDDNSMTHLTLPGLFREITGVTVEEFDSLRDGLTNEIEGEFGKGTAKMWCDILSAQTALPIAKYKGRYYKNSPAITVNNYGKGKVYYIACDMDDKALTAFCGYIAQQNGVQFAAENYIDGVEIIKRTKNGRKYAVLLNHTDKEQQVGEVTLPPYGVEIKDLL